MPLMQMEVIVKITNATIGRDEQDAIVAIPVETEFSMVYNGENLEQVERHFLRNKITDVDAGEDFTAVQVHTAVTSEMKLQYERGFQAEVRRREAEQPGANVVEKHKNYVGSARFGELYPNE